MILNYVCMSNCDGIGFIFGWPGKEAATQNGFSTPSDDVRSSVQ